MLKEIILFVFSVFLVYGIYALLILKSKKRLEAYKTSAEMKLLESKNATLENINREIGDF